MPLVRPFRRLLIANRGEIAVRIARAARAAGIAPLGIASDADANAYHVETMDDVVRIGPADAAQSYLDIERVLAAARVMRADAVHPGYGFLSERAPFALACERAGLVFVGPPPDAIAAMGDKADAKRRARAHDVPVVPGYDGDDDSPQRLRDEASRIGLPLLIKATAGGGGRGMRVVRDLAEFDDALESARREALAAFGDARVLLERYVERPRHVEIQIVADAYGTVLDFGERECSIQRRHQKVIEEAPSPGLPAEVRERMIEAAVRAARSVGYVNAGTVEFLLDPSGAFFFLEMNARLQVEHPVTELVHGVDLVRLQLAVASGERLDPYVRRGARGWAIEARIVAEDAQGRPAAGRIARWAPPEGEGLRLDSGVRNGSEISISYDSLLAKFIAFGEDRSVAIARLRDGLGRFEIDGLPTNLPQLRAIVADPAFAAGDTTTAFLDERAAALAAGSGIPEDVWLLAIAALASDERSWRIARAGLPLDLESDGRRLRVTVSRDRAGPAPGAGSGRATWRVDGDLALTFASERGGDRLTIERDGAAGPRRVAGHVAIEHTPEGRTSVLVRSESATFRLSLAAPPRRAGRDAGAEGAAGAVTSPMPGKVVRVAVATGDAVAERALLVVLEAMKMEHRVVAAVGGIVRAVHVRVGATVAAGARLVEIE